MDLESLRCFTAAATTANFRTAAASVHLSPAAFGDRIKRLEADLDCRLFERTTRRVQLTDAGKRLLPEAKRLLDAAGRCRDLVHATEPAPFDLTIGTRFELGLSWLLPALPQLQEALPERRIHLAFGDGKELLGRVRNRAIDAMISSMRLSVTGIDYASIHEERYVFVGAKQLIAESKLETSTDAGRHVLIDTDPSLPLFRYFLDAAPPKEMWSFGRIELMGAIAAVRYRVLVGAGVAVLPEYFVAPDLATGQLVRLVPKVTPIRDFFRLVFVTDHPEAHRLRELADELRNLPLK